MALSDKNIVITPNIGSSSDPKIVFSGADASTAAQPITLQVYPTNSGTLSFEGSTGQLFSITNSMTGTIFSANDVSGIPSIEVLDTGVVKLAQYNGLVGIGTADFSYITSDGTSVGSGGNAGFTNNKLYVNGSIQLLGNTDSINFGRGTGTFLKDEELGFGWGSGWYMQDATYLRVRNNVIVYSTNDMRASLFYDSNDTAYYCNPNGQSRFSSTLTDNEYTNGWFRNYSNNTGLYNENTTQHWSSNTNGYWDASSTTGSGFCGIRFYTGGHLTTLRGYVYANSSNEIGFLNSGGSWSLRCDNSGNVTATANITAYSDARLKINIQKIDNALDKVLQLNGYTYDRTDIETSRQTGVIAQEVLKVLPEVVGGSEETTYSVAYGNMVGLLIEAIKEQQAQIEELKSELKALRG